MHRSEAKSDNIQIQRIFIGPYIIRRDARWAMLVVTAHGGSN